MEQAVLQMNHVNIAYEQECVVKDFSIQVQPGEILGIVGESGGGKSTVIRAAMGLLENRGRVTDGEIIYKGMSVTGATDEELRAIRGPEMGMIFQNTEQSLCPVRRIDEQLYESVQQHKKMEKEEIRERALQIFSQMRLENGERILRSYPFELSGGMNQRVGIMMAMVLEPLLLFADEPTSALDVLVQAQVVRELIELRETYGTAIVIVTHNIGVVRKMADHIAVMHDGRLVEYGEKEAVLEDPQAPYTKKLLASVLRLKRG